MNAPIIATYTARKLPSYARSTTKTRYHVRGFYPGFFAYTDYSEPVATLAEAQADLKRVIETKQAPKWFRLQIVRTTVTISMPPRWRRRESEPPAR